LTVILTVSNLGSADAQNVTASGLLLYSDNGSGAVIAPINAGVPGGVNTVDPINVIPGNSARDFTWTYSATAEGEITFTGSASGSDSVSGAALTTLPTDTTVIITAPSASLVSAMSLIAPTNPVSYGATVRVVLSVTNTGIANAVNINPGLMTITSIGGATVTPVSSPSALALLGVNASAHFTWTYTVDNTAGTINFSATVNGQNESNLAPLSSTSNTDMIISPAGADFTMSLIASAPAVALNEVITVMLTMTNSGQQSAELVLPLVNPANASSFVPVATGTGSVVLLSGPTPLTYAANIAVGANITFVWTFSATAGGNVVFNSGAVWNYIDPIAGMTLRNSQVASNTVAIQFGQSSIGSGDRAVLSVNQFNPAAGETVDVIFSVAQGAPSASLMIFNVAGQRVRTIVSSQAVVPDITYTQLLYWDGRADDGMLVTSGIYYIKLKAGSYEAIKMVAVIKQ
jgi:hypothetical protein